MVEVVCLITTDGVFNPHYVALNIELEWVPEKHCHDEAGTL